MNAPELSDVGGVSVNAAAPYCLVGMVKLVIVGFVVCAVMVGEVE